MTVFGFATLWLLRSRSGFGLVSLSLFFAAIWTYHRHYDMVLLVPSFAYFVDQTVSKGTASRAVGFAFVRGTPHFTEPTGDAPRARTLVRSHLRCRCLSGAHRFDLHFLAWEKPNLATQGTRSEGSKPPNETEQEGIPVNGAI